MEEKTITIRSKNYIVPNYSLTGDLLAFEKCPLQYRFNNKGALPPSIPVQQWFGEFIHSVMEEAYLIWKENPEENQFIWPFEKIQQISIEVARRLRSKNLKPNSKIFCPFCEKGDKGGCPDENHPHHRWANETANLAVNGWGRYLFPLISDCEFKLQGIRPMPGYDPNVSRSRYYSITGVIDVINSVNIQNGGGNNKLIQYLKEIPSIAEMIEHNPEFEIIIDYKGMSRPKNEKSPGKTYNAWEQYARQIKTYMWLYDQNSKSEGDTKPIICGVVLYLNELHPTPKDAKTLLALGADVLRNDFHATDKDLARLEGAAKSGSDDEDELLNLSEDFLLRRSIQIIPYDEQAIKESLEDFDRTVAELESCVRSEMMNSKDVMSCWKCENYDEATCTACDLKTVCEIANKEGIKPKVP